jgi:WD40 repeat protein
LQIQHRATLTGHNAAIYCLTATDDAIWTAGGDGMLVEWQPFISPDGVLRSQLPETVFSFCFLRDKTVAAVGTMQGGLHFIDLGTKTELHSVFQHPKGVFALQTHQNALLSVGGDGSLTLWTTDTLRPAESLNLTSKALRALDVRDGRAAIGASNSHIYIVALDGGLRLTHRLENAHLPSVFAVRFSPCGQWLLTGGRDAQLKIWSVADFALHHVVPAHLNTINDISFAPDGRFFATASRDKTVKIWDSATFELCKVMDLYKNNGHVNSVNKVVWLDNQTLCSVSDDRTIRVWQIDV